MFNKLRKAVRNLFAGIAAGSLLSVPAVQADVILHAFNWEYSEVAAKAQEIANLGYKKVLVSPAYKSTGGDWWARYQPQDYRVIDTPWAIPTISRP